MTEICRFLKWDTDYFGFNIGRVTDETMDDAKAAKVLDWCSNNNIDCLYFLAAPDSYTTTLNAQRNGFELMDIRMSFRLSLKSAHTPKIDHNIRPATQDDIEPAASIARIVHKGGRFHFDPRLAHKADEFYGTWITNSINGFEDIVLICDMDSSVAGYMSCKINSDGTGQLCLLGVDPRYRGLGIGRDLVGAAHEWFISKGCQEVTVVTQGRNIRAQNIYQKYGYITDTVNYWYHWWK